MNRENKTEEAWRLAALTAGRDEARFQNQRVTGVAQRCCIQRGLRAVRASSWAMTFLQFRKRFFRSPAVMIVASL